LHVHQRVIASPKEWHCQSAKKILACIIAQAGWQPNQVNNGDIVAVTSRVL